MMTFRGLIIPCLFLLFPVLMGCASGTRNEQKSEITRESKNREKELEESHFVLTRSRLEAVGSAIKMYRMDTGRLPETLNDLVVKPGSIPEQQWQGPYLQNIPTDAWGRPLKYKQTRGGAVVYSLGADGIEGGTGEDSDIEHNIE